MPTNDSYWVPTSKQIAGLVKLKTMILDYLREYVRTSLAALAGTSFWYDAGAGGPDIDITVADKYGVGVGIYGVHANLVLDTGRILLSDSDGLGLNFPNTIATPYWVTAATAEVPDLVETNPRTGIFEFVRYIERYGYTGDNPDLVTDNGDGTITLRVNTLLGAAGTHAGRKVRVWLKVPKTNITAVAFEEITVAFAGGNNTITTTAAFGQGVISTLGADYGLMLIGPRTTTADNTNGIHVGTIVGGGAGNPPVSKDLSLQKVSSTGIGDIAEILRKDAHGKTKIRVKADSLDVDEKQIEVQSSGGFTAFSVDEDGDLVLGDGANIPAGRIFLKVLTGEVLQYVATATQASMAHSGTDVTYVLTSDGTTGVLQINKALHATKGALEFRDPNIGANLPLSDAVDETDMDTQFQTRTVLHGVNSHRRASATIHAPSILTGGIIGYPGGLDISLTDITGIQNGAYKKFSNVPNFTVTDAASRYIYITAAGAVAESATLAAIPIDAILLYRVTTAGGTLTQSATIDLRFFSARSEYRTPILVGSLDQGAHFATVGEASRFVSRFAPPGVSSSRHWTIRVIGSTIETAAISLPGGVILEGVPGANSAIKWDGDFHLFKISNVTNVIIRDLAIESTHAADDVVAVSRAVVEVNDVCTKITIKNIRMTKSAGSSAHAFIYPTATGEMDDSLIDNVYADGISDYGIFLKAAYDLTIRNCHLKQGDTAQNTGGSGILIDSGAGSSGRNLQVVGCHIESWDGYGIRLFNCAYASVRDNLIRNTGDHGIVIDSTAGDSLNASVTHNKVTGVGVAVDPAYGIHLKSGKKVLISGNDVKPDTTAVTEVGIRVEAAANTDFAIIVGNQTNGETIDNQNGANTTSANNRDDA